MNLDIQDLSVNDTESRELRTFQIRKRHDEMRSLGIIGALNVGPGWPRWTVRVRMINRNEFLSGISQFPEGIYQFCRIHFEFGCALSDVRHRNKAGACKRRLVAHDESASFSGVFGFGMFDDFIENAG